MMKDVETRKKEYRARRIKVAILKMGIAILACIVMFLIALAFSAAKSGYDFDPTDAFTVRFSGFEGEGKAELDIDKAEFIEDMEEAYAQYSASLWPLAKKYTADDFKAFANTVVADMESREELRNGDELNITVSCDTALAKDLDIELMYDEIPVSVNGLDEGIVVTKEDIFRDLSVKFTGCSPVISCEISNNSLDEFVQTVDYEIINEKEYLKNGDKVIVRATYDKELAHGAHYDVVMEDNDNTMEYKVEGFDEYVTSIDQISADDLNKAIKKGTDYFVGANEYGLRIFTEAGLPYTWIGTQDYTFEWSNPRLISAYIETLKNPASFSDSKPYNYLELAYNVHIAQANGTGCDAEAIVCFDELTVDKDGNINLNEESGQLFSASYDDQKIKNSLAGWFRQDYDLQKFPLGDMAIDYSP